MRIKLAILESDQIYLSRIVTAFSTRYADKFEIYSFTEKEMALSTVDVARIDVLLASESFEIDAKALPERCGFAYFVESKDIDSLNDFPVICKFQRAELIYKQILSIHSEHAGNLSGIKLGDESTKTIIFSSPSGGAGASTMAASCARYFASCKKRTLYLNLECFGSSEPFFEAEGAFGFSDVIYVLRSKKANLSMKLESSVKQDASGVYFFSPANLALDMLELTSDDIVRLISELKFSGSYDYIIVDLDFGMTPDKLAVYKTAHSVVWVGDGSELSNQKICRAYGAVTLKEQNAEPVLSNRLCLVYNKFSKKTGNTVGDIGLKTIGGVPRFEHATAKQVLEQVSVMKMFDNII